MQDLKTILFLADGHKQPAGATKKPESWTLASTHLSGHFVGRFQQPLFPKGIFGGLKISERAIHPDSIYENHIAAGFDVMKTMNK